MAGASWGRKIGTDGGVLPIAAENLAPGVRPVYRHRMRSSLILPPASSEAFYSATPDADATIPGDVPQLDDDSPTERFTRDDMPEWIVSDA
jgi:hypothetical protein